MHEFEKFVDDSSQEPPVRTKEAGVLTDNIHDVCSNNGFVVLAAAVLTQSQKVANNDNKKPLFNIFT